MDDGKKYRNWDSVKKYAAWRKALMRDDELLGIADRAIRKPYGVDIRMVAIVIADFGTNGHICFPGTDAVAEVVGCSERTVKNCRAQLIDLHWFKVVSRQGKFHQMILSIDIPGAEDEYEISTQAALSRAPG